MKNGLGVCVFGGRPISDILMRLWQVVAQLNFRSGMVSVFSHGEILEVWKLQVCFALL